MLNQVYITLALAAAAALLTGVDAGPFAMTLCPPGWNETDYRCYYFASVDTMTWNEAEDVCYQMGVGARVAYPADSYELAMIGRVASGSSVWLGYISEAESGQYKTFYRAIGFPNQFGDTSDGRCGIYKNINDGTLLDPSYQLASLPCTGQASVICQMSYCSPAFGAPDPSLLWIEFKLRCYYYNALAKSYSDAQDWCALHGGALAAPDMDEEHDFLNRIFGLANKKRWLGVKAEYTADGSSYEWQDPAAENNVPAYWGWPASGSPVIWNNNTCVYLNGSTLAEKWSVQSCSTNLPFVCRRVVGSLGFANCTRSIYGRFSAWTADCTLAPGSQTRRWRKCIAMCIPYGCSQVTAKYCQYQPKWSTWGPWGGCVKPSKGSFQMASTPCLFNGRRIRSRTCMCGDDACGGCGSPGDSAGATQSANCNLFYSNLCPSDDCTYCTSQFPNTHCYEDGSTDSLTNNFRCACNLGYYKYSTDLLAMPMGCTFAETNDDSSADCECSYTYNECQRDYHSCTTEQLCQYPEGGPHSCFCLPGYRKIPSGGCVAASRIPPQCKIVSGSSFLKDKRGEPLIPYSRGYICTCGDKKTLVDAGYSTKNFTSGEEAAARITSRDDKYMCYCMRATVGAFLRTDDITNRPVETKFNLTRQFMENFPECEMGFFDNFTYPKIPADLFTDVDLKLVDLQKRTYFKCTGAEGFNSPVLGEALSPPLEEPATELEAMTRLLSVDEAAVDLMQSMLSPDCETQRSYLIYTDVMSGTEVFIGNVSYSDLDPTFVPMQCGNWSFPPKAVDRTNYPGAYQPLIAHCYVNVTKFKTTAYNSTIARLNQTTLDQFVKKALRQKGFSFAFAVDEYSLPVALLNSGIMSISTNPHILKMPANTYLNIWFPLNEPLAGHYEPHCTFYDFGYITGPTWRTKESGCITEHLNASSDGPGYVRCQCSHMTIFAVTMIEVIPTAFHLAAFILNAIVIGGSGLSIICLALTLLIYIQLRRFSTERIGIMILCFTIGMTQALLLAGAKLTLSRGTCRIVSIMLHFFGLITFSLIGSLSLAMFFRFVTKFKRGWQNVLAYYGLGFGVPVITVSVSAGGFWSSYGMGDSCWMDMEGLIKWAFFVPFMVVGILSLYLLIRVGQVIFKVKGQSVKSFSQAEVYGVEFKYGAQRKQKIDVIFDLSKKKFWGYIILLVILTCTWVLGILSMQYDSIYYHYGFAIFNASQGFFIFIMFCIREEEVRILCCAGCMSKQQPAGKITWTKFVDIYERYFALVLHSQEKEKNNQLTFNEFVSQEYKAGALNPDDITAMGSHEYVAAQMGLAKPNYLLTCSCCFPVKTAPMPFSSIPQANQQVDFNQMLFVVGPDGQMMCLDKDGQNAGEIMDEIGQQRPGSMAAFTGSAGPGGRNVSSAGKPIKEDEPPNPSTWAPPPTLFPEFPDSDEEGDVAADIAPEVKINRNLLPQAKEPPKPAPAPIPKPEPEPERPSTSMSDNLRQHSFDEDDEDDDGGVIAAEPERPSTSMGDEEPERPSTSMGDEEPRPSTAVDEDDDKKAGDWPKAPSDDEDETPADRPTSARPGTSASMRPPSARPQSAAPQDDDDERPSSSKPDKPSSGRPRSSRKETDELDPLDLDDDD